MTFDKSEWSREKSVRWLILDNVFQQWHYCTNLEHHEAARQYLWLVNNEYIKDGRITSRGREALLSPDVLEG